MCLLEIVINIILLFIFVFHHSLEKMSEQTGGGGSITDTDIADNDTQGKEIYTYAAPWTVFAMAWSHR